MSWLFSEKPEKKVSLPWVTQTLRAQLIKPINIYIRDTQRLTKEPVVSILFFVCFCYICNWEEIKVMNFFPNTSLPLACLHVIAKMKVNLTYLLNLAGF